MRKTVYTTLVQYRILQSWIASCDNGMMVEGKGDSCRVFLGDYTSTASQLQLGLLAVFSVHASRDAGLSGVSSLRG